jgi:hypothetical protein
MKRCDNCDTPMEASFCPQCGQKNIELERPLSALLGEVLRETFDLDGRAARTLWTLVRRPGLVTAEFLAGHRRRYTPPLRLYLVLSVLFFLVTAWIAELGILLNEGQTLEADALGQARFVADDLPRLMVVLLPLFALLLKAAYKRRFYFDHLIHSVHLHCIAYLLLAMMLPLEQAASQSIVLAMIQVILLGYLLSYLVISLHHVYQDGWLKTVAKAFGVFVGYLSLLFSSIQLISQYRA